MKIHVICKFTNTGVTAIQEDRSIVHIFNELSKGIKNKLTGPNSSSGRASASRASGRGFDTWLRHNKGNTITLVIFGLSSTCI